MPETPPFSRTARLEDFLCDGNNTTTQYKYNKNYSHNNSDTIAKNQQEFGNRKRIKP